MPSLPSCMITHACVAIKTRAHAACGVLCSGRYEALGGMRMAVSLAGPGSAGAGRSGGPRASAGDVRHCRFVRVQSHRRADSARALMPFSIRRSIAKSPNSIKIRLNVASRRVCQR